MHEENGETLAWIAATAFAMGHIMYTIWHYTKPGSSILEVLGVLSIATITGAFVWLTIWWLFRLDGDYV